MKAFDRYVDEQKKDPAFAAEYERAGVAVALRDLEPLVRSVPCQLCETKGGSNIVPDGGCRHRTSMTPQEIVTRAVRVIRGRSGADAGVLDALRVVRAWWGGSADPAERDELVAICTDGLKPFGLELQAVQRLVADGKLRAVRIGRRAFTKRSYLLALVDELPQAANRSGAPDEKDVDIEDVARRSAARRKRRRDGGK